MLSAPTHLKVATRKSRLALWQANYVCEQLTTLYPNCQIDLVEMTTLGDQILDRSLSKVGGKGLFIKELEVALLEGQADLAVHSLKDMPADLADAFAIAAVLPREDPRDALVCADSGPIFTGLEQLPQAAVLGTSSLRREAQLRVLFPHLEVRPLRGNLDTRLSKLDRGEYTAIVLAAAGLKRLGLQNRISGWLDPAQSLPAPSQGAIAIEVLSQRATLNTWLQALMHIPTLQQITAEREVSRLLGGSCQLPLAAYAQHQENGDLFLRARVANPYTLKIIHAELSGSALDAAALASSVVEQLKQKGAQSILDELRI